MDLSKAFDTLPHDLLIAKLDAYGLDPKGLKLIYSYLSNRQMCFCIGGSVFSEWLRVLLGVPQGSISSAVQPRNMTWNLSGFTAISLSHR